MIIGERVIRFERTPGTEPDMVTVPCGAFWTMLERSAQAIRLLCEDDTVTATVKQEREALRTRMDSQLDMMMASALSRTAMYGPDDSETMPLVLYRALLATAQAASTALIRAGWTTWDQMEARSQLGENLHAAILQTIMTGMNDTGRRHAEARRAAPDREAATRRSEELTLRWRRFADQRAAIRRRTIAATILLAVVAAGVAIAIRWTI